MAEQKHTPDVDFFTKVEDFFQANQKPISIGTSAVLLVVLAFIGINNFYLPGKEKDAQSQMFRAEQYFEKDSFKLALNGDGNYPGFLKIMDDYAWTDAACLAHYRAGICYLHLGDYDNAITQLKKFSTGEPVVSAMALGALGDAYSEKNQMDEAISYYKKAAKEVKNELVTPYYLFKAGLALKVKGSKEEALKFFQEIKNDYPDSTEGKDIDRYIAMVS